MASQGSKGNRKRHSEAQKNRYAAHKFRLAGNKIKRLKRHIKRNAYDIARKGRRGRVIKSDWQALHRLKELTT